VSVLKFNIAAVTATTATVTAVYRSEFLYYNRKLDLILNHSVHDTIIHRDIKCFRNDILGKVLDICLFRS